MHFVFVPLKLAFAPTTRVDCAESRDPSGLLSSPLLSSPPLVYDTNRGCSDEDRTDDRSADGAL